MSSLPVSRLICRVGLSKAVTRTLLTSSAHFQTSPAQKSYSDVQEEKKPVLEAASRPLYLDVQATTPMVDSLRLSVFLIFLI